MTSLLLDRTLADLAFCLLPLWRHPSKPSTAYNTLRQIFHVCGRPKKGKKRKKEKERKGKGKKKRKEGGRRRKKFYFENCCDEAALLSVLQKSIALDLC